MKKTQFISDIKELIEKLPLPIIKMKESDRVGGGFLYSGPIPNTSLLKEWIEKAFWMLETSAVLARNLPSGKFVAMAYKDGYVVISEDLKNSLSEEMHRACTVATYSDFEIQRDSTCLVFTQVPFELSVVFNDDDSCMVFLTGNPNAEVVVYSQARLNQMKSR